jgi:hypothetical protein
MTDREWLAADLLACERFIQAHEGRNPAEVAFAKRWLVELEARGAELLGVRRPSPNAASPTRRRAEAAPRASGGRARQRG